jgi:hypothetical protein
MTAFEALPAVYQRQETSEQIEICRSFRRSSIVIEVEAGKVVESLVQPISQPDAVALLGALALAIVEVTRAVQTYGPAIGL